MNLVQNLELLEQKFGGLVEAISEYTHDDLELCGSEVRMARNCQGGDRFSGSGMYGSVYGRNIEKFLNKKVNIFEIGILKGTGLAIWNDIFLNKETKIIGGDIFIDNFLENFNNLKQLGGFKDIDKVNLEKENFANSRLSCFRYDQYDPMNSNFIKEIIKEEKLDIVIDDGDHQDVPNLETAKALIGHMENKGIYFLEDVKPHRVEYLVSEFKKIGYDFIDNSFYKDGRVGGVLVFQFNNGE